ncbi:hypothetical protein [Streptomyces sp. NPDC058671]|uniref:hypothetical protein n=1 Tax=Streptomyces sp. NPDC058671 TaxID=3346590 RepID=UPI0036641063
MGWSVRSAYFWGNCGNAWLQSVPPRAARAGGDWSLAGGAGAQAFGSCPPDRPRRSLDPAGADRTDGREWEAMLGGRSGDEALLARHMQPLLRLGMDDTSARFDEEAYVSLDLLSVGRTNRH